MTLSRNQIIKWSQRGDPIHAWYSYEMVRETLTSSKLSGMSCAVYPQGSYANKTNIAADSDVDMVIALRSAFYPEKSELSAGEHLEYEKYYQEADVRWQDFRDLVVGVLKSSYLVHKGSKAVKVRSNLIRLPADVLIALEYRFYKTFPSFEKQTFIDGVQFYDSDDGEIVNFPKRHIRACGEKDRRTDGKYRPVVRVAKNARNALIADSKTEVRAGIAPSYFLESLLWNVPEECYRGDLENAYGQVITWLCEHIGQLALMKFPSGMGKIFDRTADTSWDEAKAQAIVRAMCLQLNS